MHAVDTNVLVRLIVRDEPRQTVVAEEFVKKGAWVSVVALAEAVWVLATAYRLDSNRQATAIEMLLQHRDLTIQDAETVEAALELFRTKPSLGFSDCLILKLARKAGHTPLGTFDRALAKNDGTYRLR